MQNQFLLMKIKVSCMGSFGQTHQTKLLAKIPRLHWKLRNLFSRLIQCFFTFGLSLQTLLLVELVLSAKARGLKAIRDKFIFGKLLYLPPIQDMKTYEKSKILLVILLNNVTVLEILGIPFLIASHGSIFHGLVAKFPARDQVSTKGDSLTNNPGQRGLGKEQYKDSGVEIVHVYKKHRKNCENCPVSLLIEGSLWMLVLLVSIVRNVMNFHKGLQVPRVTSLALIKCLKGNKCLGSLLMGVL